MGTSTALSIDAVWKKNSFSSLTDAREIFVYVVSRYLIDEGQITTLQFKIYLLSKEKLN